MRSLLDEKKIRITVSDLIDMIKEARMGPAIVDYDDINNDELFENFENEVDKNDFNMSVSIIKK